MKSETPPDDSSTSRRSVLETAGATIAGLSLAGCLDSTANSETTADTIRVAAVEGEGHLFQQLVKEYVEDETGVDVEVELMPYDALFERNVSVINQKSDAFDLVFMDDPWFPRLALGLDPVKQWLPEGVPDQYIDTTIDIATWPAPRGPVVPEAEDTERKLRGLVVVGNCQLFMYNRTYYEEVGANPPDTWDDVLEAGRAIDENIDGVSGYVIRGRRGNPIMANYYSMGVSLAGKMFDNDWGYAWNSQKGADAIDFYANKLAEISPDGVESFDSNEVVGSVGDGTAAQSPVWPWAPALLLEEDAPAADDLEFTVIPKGVRRAPQQGNWLVGINSFTTDAKKRAAGEVLQSFVSAEAQSRYVEFGGVPFRHDTFKENLDLKPWFEALYESIQTAQWRPRTPKWSDIEKAQGLALHDVLTNRSEPADAVEQAAGEIEGILGRAGYYD